MLMKAAKNARKNEGTVGRLASLKKAAAAGLVALAASCGGERVYYDGNAFPPRDGGPVEAGADADQDSDARADADAGGPGQRFDAAFDADYPCPTLECGTSNEARNEVRLDIGGSTVVGGVRITALSDDGPNAWVTLTCDESGEVYAEGVRLQLNSIEAFSVDTATVELMCFGIIGGTRLFMNVNVTTPCGPY
jgi:hypothetical protein